ncbi:ABC transporter I family member 11, chloroplastic [Vitis vinifera]|uniref:ABC transporter I family member 11, chloroplastic n=1 Tax=Vitis vinifera TaxID=29760 RepID=A0A438EB59_VITVI|nr:ABC transporter I family member 11, chloroplastic [Vitis vinifera]
MLSWYFVADNVLEEVTFGWPRQRGSFQLKEHLALGLERAINWVGLNGISLDKDPHSLSGGYKRRLALAIQLVQIPDLLILDEPLAGLGMMMHFLIFNPVISWLLLFAHGTSDVPSRELAALVDRSWRMEMGGVLKEEPIAF